MHGFLFRGQNRYRLLAMQIYTYASTQDMDLLFPTFGITLSLLINLSILAGKLNEEIGLRLSKFKNQY